MKVEDVRNPQLALEYANRAVETAGSPNPVYMRALAWAYYRLGNRAKAIRTLEQARNSLLH
jgi:tetratricopeptide (TPR) repeat protein